MKVKKLLTIISVLLMSLVMTTNVSAYYADVNVVRSGAGPSPSGTPAGDYLGYIGNVQDGVTIIIPPLPFPAVYPVTTSRTKPDGAGGASYATNNNAEFTATGANVHWYDFSLSSPSALDLRFEAGFSMDYLDISFFFEDGDTLKYNTTYNNGDSGTNFGGHWNDVFSFFNQKGDWWMRVEGAPLDGDESSGYTITFTAIPLPPALLLFASAIAGFGVMGARKGKRRLAS